MDHSALAFINDLARLKGSLSAPHPNARPLPEDNGERFFSEYLHEQRDRNKILLSDPSRDRRCQCNKCAKSESLLPRERQQNMVMTNNDNIVAPTAVIQVTEKVAHVNAASVPKAMTTLIAEIPTTQHPVVGSGAADSVDVINNHVSAPAKVYDLGNVAATASPLTNSNPTLTTPLPATFPTIESSSNPSTETPTLQPTLPAIESDTDSVFVADDSNPTANMHSPSSILMPLPPKEKKDAGKPSADMPSPFCMIQIPSNTTKAMNTSSRFSTAAARRGGKVHVSPIEMPASNHQKSKKDNCGVNSTCNEGRVQKGSNQASIFAFHQMVTPDPRLAPMQPVGGFHNSVPFQGAVWQLRYPPSKPFPLPSLVQSQIQQSQLQTKASARFAKNLEFKGVIDQGEIAVDRKRQRAHYEEEDCCDDYRAYFARQHRKGRPPHHPTCPKFNGKR